MVCRDSGVVIDRIRSGPAWTLPGAWPRFHRPGRRAGRLQPLVRARAATGEVPVYPRPQRARSTGSHLCLSEVGSKGVQCGQRHWTRQSCTSWTLKALSPSRFSPTACLPPPMSDGWVSASGRASRVSWINYTTQVIWSGVLTFFGRSAHFLVPRLRDWACAPERTRQLDHVHDAELMLCLFHATRRGRWRSIPLRYASSAAAGIDGRAHDPPEGR